MNTAIASIIAGLLNFAFELWRKNAGKPEGWMPTPDDYRELLNEVDAATPEAEKDAARKRLGLT